MNRDYCPISLADAYSLRQPIGGDGSPEGGRVGRDRDVRQAPHRAHILALMAVLAAPFVVLLSASAATAAPDDPRYAPPATVVVLGHGPRMEPAPEPAPQVPAAESPPSVAPLSPPSTILRNALPTMHDVLTNPRGLAIGTAAAVLWLALVALPSVLLDSSIEKRSHGRMGRALAAFAGTLDRLIEEVSRGVRWKLAGPLLVALLAGTAFGFADPHLAWDARSLSTIGSLFVALTLITVVASNVGSRLARRWWGLESAVRAEPLGLLAAVAGVAVGRLLSLSPGLFLGLVVGVDVGENADQPRRSKAVVARHAVVFAFAMLAWVAYSLFFAESGHEGGHGEGGGGLAGFMSDVLTATTIEGLTFIVISLLPLPLLAGREVFAHSRRLWIALYGTVAVVFSVVALPTILGEHERSAATLARQGVVMFAFCAITVLSWLRSRSRAKATEELLPV